MQAKTLGELADCVGGMVTGDRDIKINSVATLANAGPGDITFLVNQKYTSQFETTKASAIIVGKDTKTNTSLLIADDPYYALMQIVVLLHGHRQHPKTGISDKASIAQTAQIGPASHINDFAVIESNAKIGARCVLYPGSFIGADTKIGDDCILYPNAVVFDKCSIGNRVIIQANATVGEDGFGFATHNGDHHKIPQIGRVVIEDDVEIGAGAAIERGTLDDTVIGKGTKIGDIVAIGHGARIGPGCLLVPQVGVAGSASLGHHCVIGGQAGIVGHIKIGNMVKIAAQAGVINDVEDGTSLLGGPAIEAGKGKRAYSLIGYLPEMKKRIRRLEKELEKLQNNKKP